MDVKELIVSYSQLDPAENLLLFAVQAPHNEIFYQNSDSIEW